MWIFISHRTDRTVTADVARLLTLRTELIKAAGGKQACDVLLDMKRLRAGYQWRPTLHDWMARCHAAVILFTPGALQSPWVLQEATILAHRAARDPRFRLFPVLLDGVTPAQLNAPGSQFSALQLAEIQKISAQDPAAMAAEIHQELARFAPDTLVTPMDELISDLAGLMESAKPARLEAICAQVSGKPVFWEQETTRVERAARDLARAVVAGRKGPYASVLDLAFELVRAGLSKEQGRSVLNLLAPLWVDLAAAAPMAVIGSTNVSSTDRTKRRALSLNGSLVPDYTAQMYMRRVYLPRTRSLYPIDGGDAEDRLASLSAKIFQEIREREGLPNASDKKLESLLKSKTEPCFIVLPPPVPDEQLMTKLHERFPSVTFIAHEDGEDGTLPMEPQHSIVPLRPSLQEADEMSMFNAFSSARTRIDQA